MKRMVLLLSTLLLAINLTACSNTAPRITPGHLAISDKVDTHSARITNIIQLSEKEAPDGKVFLGSLAGIATAAILTDDSSDLVQDIATDLGADIGAGIATEKYGKTIYKLTLALDDGSVKHIHVRGGAYVVGRHAKITVDKKSGGITSLVALRS